jgi:DNA-binding GntR family transcriptional regulator
MPRHPVTSSLTEKAYERLREALMIGRLRPGERLKIGELCETLATNLSAIREALARLTSEGLVIAEPQRGFRAAPVSVADLADLTRVRIEIEALCLRAAVQHGDADWEARILSSLAALQSSPAEMPGDPLRVHENYWPVHASFHQAVCSGCNSPWLLRLRETLYTQSERYRAMSVPAGGAERGLHAEHQAIAAALLARDADRAVHLMQSHLQLTTDLVIHYVTPEPASSRPRRGRPPLARPAPGYAASDSSDG